MEPMESQQQKLTRVVSEVGAAMHRRARGEWGKVRTARRNLGDRHVWRFRTGAGEPDRFLMLSHQSMTSGDNPAAAVLAQLDKADWLERMQAGPETVFRLSAGGGLRARPAA